MPRMHRSLAATLFAAALGAASASAQVSLTTLGTPYTQNFDTLPASGSATWTNNSSIPGWFHARTGTGTTIVANDGSSNAGNLYSYGTGTATERALGSVGSGNAAVGNLFYGVRLQNNTGTTITQLDVSYIGEQWRNSAAAAQTVTFSYLVGSPTVTGSLAEFQSAGVAVPSLDFTSPITGGVAGALNGNLAANRVTKTFSITGLSIPNGTEVMLRWADPDHTGADHGMSVDDFSVTPLGAVVNAPVVPSCPASLSTVFGAATSTGVSASDTDGTVTSATISGITPSDPGTITLTGFTPAGGVGGTANATLNVSNTTPVGSYNVSIQWANNDVSPQTATCVVAVSVVAITKIHDVQGNGAATPIPGATVAVEGIVTANFQGTGKLQGFFLQEEDADADADPATSEGIFVFCSSCPTPVAEGQRVRVTGSVSEFFNMTEITASTAPAIVIVNAGNNLAQVTPTPIDLPVVGVINDFYESREGMLVTFVDSLSVSEYFELFRYGQVELYQGGRPRQFTEANPPSVAGYTAHLDNLSRRVVVLDDENNTQNWPLTLADGSQFVFHPRANGGFSIGTQGTDFFRGGDVVNGLTGVLDWSFAGLSGTDAWRIRPTLANPAAFTVVNPRPAAPPAVGGAIRVAGMNLLNYFTTIDTTSSSTSGPCGPAADQDCRGADSVAELNRQRERASIVVCGLDADVVAFMELENTTPSDTVNDLLAAINAGCGGADPYAFVNTGGTLGTDAIRVQLIYRSATVSPVGAPLADLDPIHNRPPTAQTFDVVDAANPAFGERFTVIANHFKSKGCDASAVGPDADLGDGQGCYNGRRTSQATRLLTWISGTVLPAAGDPDVVLLGDFNSYGQENPVTTLAGGGFTDLEAALLGPNAYSYLFDGQLGHLDYAFASAALVPQVTGVGAWHINADEVPLFDYNDEIKDVGEATFEEKPDGSALVPPRVVFQPATAFRASDHDPVLLGLFQIADLAVTKVEGVDPVIAGTNLSYTITVTNNGPDPATNVSWSDTLPAGTAFVSLPSVAGWTCTTPAVGGTGAVSCSIAGLPVGSAVFTLTVAVDPSLAAGTVLSNTASATSDTGDGNSGNNSATETTTVATASDLSVTKVDTPDPVNAGTNLAYTIDVNNAGPSTAASVSLADTLPAGTTFVSLASPGGWSCTTPAIGAGGTINCSIAALAPGNASFTLTVAVDSGVASGTVISNTATVSSATTDPAPGNESGTAATTVGTSSDLSVTKVDTPDPVAAGTNLTYTITMTNAGPSAAASVSLSDTVPAGTTFVSLSSPGGWSCGTPAVGGTGLVSCSVATLPVGSVVFTLTVQVGAGVSAGAVISNTATASSTTPDPTTGNESATATTTVSAGPSDLGITKVDSPDPVTAGNNLTYTITATNGGPADAASASLSDTLPAATTFVSLSSPAGWSCTTPAVGAGGTVNCSIASFPVGSAPFTLTVHVDAALTGGGILSNTATVTSASTDPNPGNESATATTAVTGLPASVTATKTAAGSFQPGSTVTYTVVLSNAGPGAQPDAAGDEFTDLLPSALTLVSASATSGAATANPGTNTVTWNGTIPAGGSVTVTIQATLASVALPGSTVSNQGSVSYDSDGDGTNDAAGTTDDPSTGAQADATAFVVAAPAVAEIPALDPRGLLALAVLLAAAAIVALRR